MNHTLSASSAVLLNAAASHVPASSSRRPARSTVVPLSPLTTSPELPAPSGGTGRVAGFAVVALVHVVVGYALLSGLAHKVVETVRAPFEARLIEEIKEPPPPPPKPVVVPQQIVKKVAPPPPFVPPPEVAVAPPPPAPTIAAVTPEPPPAPIEVQPTPEPPPAPPPAPAAPQAVAIGVACPSMVAPVLPRRAQDNGIGGTVRARATIRGGKVVDVQILSATPRGLFDDAVKTAMLNYGCNTTGATEIVATQVFQFRSSE